MSSHDYSRSRQRHTAPLAADSAFGYEAEVHRSSSRSPSRRSGHAATGTHFMAGDQSKIFNPVTGKYVKIDGKVGQEVLSTYGYPQEGGFSFTETNDQLTKSLSDLYNNLMSTWDGLWSTTTTARKSSSRKAPVIDASEATKPKSQKKYKKNYKKYPKIQTGGEHDIDDLAGDVEAEFDAGTLTSDNPVMKKFKKYLNDPDTRESAEEYLGDWAEVYPELNTHIQSLI